MGCGGACQDRAYSAADGAIGAFGFTVRQGRLLVLRLAQAGSRPCPPSSAAEPRGAWPFVPSGSSCSASPSAPAPAPAAGSQASIGSPRTSSIFLCSSSPTGADFTL